MHPYSALPSSSYWRRSIEGRTLGLVDPILRTAIKINQRTKVATAGSCFAQRLGVNWPDFNSMSFVRNQRRPKTLTIPSTEFFRGVREHLHNSPAAAAVVSRVRHLQAARSNVAHRTGRFLDPFRPGLREDGFSSSKEVLALQQRHFASVRQLFEQADVLIYTLGLTETWLGPDDEAIPVVPGAVNAEVHGDQYRYSNPPVEVMRHELERFLFDLRLINPRISVILTVSPVAMIATYEPRHVLVSNTYSKAALRVIAEEFADRTISSTIFRATKLSSARALAALTTQTTPGR